ncbi:hypothetical protein AWH48_16925 [Domibacillus aminovorans]|uniref:Uncharacterized protein n=1 Tax=Domibacillus aminovorans TaxID=29332 RepID=A0A177KZ93_9BACI|nr:hypothetical protein [Domibacillus aminovorans]OAH58680.1 hypothetical protein AWH48_16925 [Domibacillus aminovorans]
MLLNENYTLGVIKEVGDRHVVLDVEGKEVNRALSEEEATQLHTYVLEQTNLLIPINKETNELFMELGSGEQWNELEMQELQGASDPLDEDHDSKA